MSFDVEKIGGYSGGICSSATNLGEVFTSSDTGAVGVWLPVSAVNDNVIICGGIIAEYFAVDLEVGADILIHHSLCKSTSPSSAVIANLGKYEVRRITEIDDNGLTLDAAPDIDLTNFYVQAVVIQEFENFTLREDDSMYPISCDAGGLGGILAVRVRDTLTLAGGHIDLIYNGIPTSAAAYRPLTPQEQNGTLDANLYAGCENSITKDRLLLNVGDGAVFLIAKKIVVENSSSRIGNPSTYGVQYCRGASDSINKPAGVTNVGGSSIFIVAEEITGFDPKIIAKYRSTSGDTGKGLARAYIATHDINLIKPDEGLYAHDVIHDNTRLKRLCNFSGFGNGQLGDITYTGNVIYSSTGAQKCWNQYAKVTAISGRVYTLSKKKLACDSHVDFTVGTLVVIVQSLKSSANDVNDGNFKFSRITAVSGSTVTIKHNFSFDLSTYNVQMIAVAEFNNLTLGYNYSCFPPYENGSGGIAVVACAGTFNLSNGKINVEGLGTFNSIPNPFNDVKNPMRDNHSMKSSLPLGQGHGSVLVLAKNLVMNESSRIGATYDGALFGGTAIKDSSHNRTAQGGWKGTDGTPGQASGHENDYGTAGHGGGAGTCPYFSDCDGGWFSNASFASAAQGYTYGCQGAHVLIIADTITGLNLSALSTGGKGGCRTNGTYSNPDDDRGMDGGCGYGGGGMSMTTGTLATSYRFGGSGGYRGGGGAAFRTDSINFSGGGSGAACFVYCNHISNQVKTGLITT